MFTNLAFSLIQIIFKKIPTNPISIAIWLEVYPSEKYGTSSVGMIIPFPMKSHMMTFPMESHNPAMFQTTNQAIIVPLLLLKTSIVAPSAHRALDPWHVAAAQI